MKLIKKQSHNTSIIAEFILSKHSLDVIAKLSQYVKNISKSYKMVVITDLQRHPKGYRITYNISSFTTKNRYNYFVTELADISSWVCDSSDCLIRYQYNYN